MMRFSVKKISCNLLPTVLTACFLSILCANARGETAGRNSRQTLSTEDTAGVIVSFNSLDNATRYTISSGDCSITWIAYNSELNKGIIKHSAVCPAPLSQQLPLLEKICGKFLSSDRNVPSFRTLFWGGLEPERRPASLEMPLRLALAAYRSSGWDAKKGKPKSGDFNGFVKDLANSAMIYPELKELFKRFNRNVSLASVEKVRVLKAEQLPFYDKLKEHGIKPSDKLPFDCMAWFSVSTMSQK
jgi:hypothetical protein